MKHELHVSGTVRAVASAAAFAAAFAAADTYTWTGAANNKWDKTSANWTTDGGASNVAWADGNDAVFANASALTVTVHRAVMAGDITKPKTAGNVALTFKGSGPLSWTGMFSTPALGSAWVYLDCPIADNGNGLHFDIAAHCYLRAHNLHTGGTHIRNSRGTSGVKVLAINGGTQGTGTGNDTDLALGPVPETVCTNIFVEGGKVALYCDSSFDIPVHENRTIWIANNATNYLNPAGTLRIMGNIVGEPVNGHPTGTRVEVGTSADWKGLTVFHGSNHIGRLYVPGRLEIADGRTYLVTSGQGTANNAALYIVGDGKTYYDGNTNKRGYLLVSGGLLTNNQNGYRFQTSAYGHLDIAGGQVYLASETASEFLNGMSSPGKVTVRDGGLFRCSLFRISQTTAGNGGELFLEDGGSFRVREMWVDFGSKRKGAVHFNGGALMSADGNDEVSVTRQPNNANWDGTVFKVEAGGAVFDTSNGQNIWFGRPLLPGLAAGETDGGLTAKLGSGCAVVLHDSAECSYTGPTRLEAVGSGSGDRTLQCRVANALPADTTLQVGPGCAAAFNDYNDDASQRVDLAQTIRRLEGTGNLKYNSALVVTNAVAPVFDGAYGTLTFEKPCSLSGDFEISGDTNGCGRLKFERAGQDISKLALKVDFSGFDEDASGKTYKILDAPGGYTGRFDESDIPSHWVVRYEQTAAYIAPFRPFVMVLR